MGVAAFCAGCAGFYLFWHAVVSMPAALVDAIPDQEQAGFMAVWFAHVASYLVGFTGPVC